MIKERAKLAGGHFVSRREVFEGFLESGPVAVLEWSSDPLEILGTVLEGSWCLLGPLGMVLGGAANLSLCLSKKNTGKLYIVYIHTYTYA